MLVRKFVGKRLAEYYAQPSHAVVGSVIGNYTDAQCKTNHPTDTTINFKQLLGEWHWKRIYRGLYDKQDGQWLTPVELFQPYYSYTLANFVALSLSGNNKTHQDFVSQPSSPQEAQQVHVVELGGGLGTNAELILDRVSDIYPELYNRLRYTIIDGSPSLHALQRTRFLQGPHADRVEFIQQDLLEVAEGKAPLLPKSSDRTVVLALELFDNLPHDKIKMLHGRIIHQAELCKTDNFKNSKDELASYTEKFVPLSDPLLKHVIQTVPAFTRSSSLSWIPTVACGVMKQLYEQRPQAQLLVADFDWLPAPDLEDDVPALLPTVGSDEAPEKDLRQRQSTPATGEPLVTSMDDKDFQCYLQAPKYCDILFPTDFAKLAIFAKHVWGGSTEKYDIHVQKQASFLEEYGAEQVEQTKSWLTGYTPLLHDFGNCSVLTVRQKSKQ